MEIDGGELAILLIPKGGRAAVGLKGGDHEVDLDPTRTLGGPLLPDGLRFETSADLRDERTRQELLEWLIEEIRPAAEGGRFRRID